MLPKPSHWNQHNASTFQEPSVVERYIWRPPYSSTLFDALLTLIEDEPATVLDIGCGPGDIARGLVDRVQRVDAVDISRAMIDLGQTLPNGQHAHLRWIHAPVESTNFNAPYALITAGDSLHWMEWDVLFPRLAAVGTPNARFALVSRGWGVGVPEERALFARYSTVRDFKPTSLVDELTQRGLFVLHGEIKITPTPWTPTMTEYIAARHSHSGCSLERMNAEDAAAFDDDLRQLLHRLCREGHIQMQDRRLQLETWSSIKWGTLLS